jgi:hypothetical protein
VRHVFWTIPAVNCRVPINSGTTALGDYAEPIFRSTIAAFGYAY